MTRRQKQWSVGFLAVALLGLSVGWAVAQRDDARTVAPETLLPANAVAYVGIDGALQHAEAWQRTAAYEALYKSGLMDLVNKIVAAVQQQTGGQEGPAGHIAQAATHIMDHGVSLAVSAGDGAAGPPTPWAVLVLHDAAMMEEALAQLAVGASRGEIDFQTTEANGRSVTHGVIPNSPGVELGWWTEGKHLVVVAGINAVKSAVSVADGTTPNLSTSPLWKKYRAADAGFEATSVAWLDFAALRQRIGGMPLPIPNEDPNRPPVRIDDILQIVGLNTLNSVVHRSGYKGRAIWSETDIEAPGPRTGLLALSDQEPISLADLPPLPQVANAFAANSFDWSRLYDALLEVAHGIEQIAPNAGPGTVDNALAQFNDHLGISLRDDLLGSLGHVNCAYADSGQVPFGLGFGLALEVKDAARLRKALNSVLDQAQQHAGPDLNVRRIDRSGRELVVLEFNGGAFSPAFHVGEKWLSVGMVPQTVDAFLLRLDGKLPTWEPTPELQAALGEMPDKFTAITTGDPRPTFQMVMGVAPFLIGAAQAGLKQAQVLPPDFVMPISVADVPPAELVVRPLFPNVSVAVVGKDGMKYTSRTSLPSMPFAGAFDGGTSVATTGVLVALLLPAIQQAREAARRSQSMNNLRQILLALHNYHDTYNQFPEGTQLNEKLKPDERLSWLSKILPFIDQAPLFQQIDFDEGWEDEVNQQESDTVVPVFLNPGVAQHDVAAATDYVGVAGLGKEGPTLPVTSTKAGVFGYNRATGLRDILDGTSNTIAVVEASNAGRWAAGGKSTIRPFTTKPYINGPDGIGGPYRGGMNAAFADGSVRFISENIDATVLEALTTIRGGEVVGDF